MVRGLAAIGIDPSAHGLRRRRCPDVSTLPENVRIVVEQAFGNGIADLFLVAAPLALISLIAVLFLREVPLGTRSGIEQLLEQEGEALAPATAAARRRPERRRARRPDAEQRAAISSGD